MKIAIKHFSILLLSYFIFCLPGFTESTILLEYRPEPGSSFEFVEAEVQIDRNNANPPGIIKTISRHKFTVEKIYPDGSFDLSRRIVEISALLFDDEGELIGIENPKDIPSLLPLLQLFEQPTTIKVSKRGEILSVTTLSENVFDQFYTNLEKVKTDTRIRIQVDFLIQEAFNEDNIRSYLRRLLVLYPEYPLKEGTEWTIPFQTSTEAFHAAGTQHFRLESINNTANLTMNRAVDKYTSKNNAITFELGDMRLEGTYEIDLKTGFAKNANLTNRVIITSYQTRPPHERTKVLAEDTLTENEFFIRTASDPPIDMALLQKSPVSKQPPSLPLLETLADYSEAISRLRAYGDRQKADQLTQDVFKRFESDFTGKKDGQKGFISMTYLGGIGQLSSEMKWQKADRLMQELLGKFRLDELGPNGHFQFSLLKYEIEMKLGRFVDSEQTILTLLSKFEPLLPEYEKMGKTAKYYEMVRFVKKDLSEVYSHRGNYEKAQFILAQLKTDFEKEKDESGLSLVFYRIGRLYKEQKQYAQAETHLKQSLVFYHKIYGKGSPGSLPHQYDLCEVQVALNKFSEAEATCNFVKEQYRKQQDPTVDVDLNLAKIYMAQKRFTEAKSLIEPSIELLEFMLPRVTRILGSEHVTVQGLQRRLVDFKTLNAS